ncbi:MAG TPA: aldolase/citrate lyase family protein [Candidatus Methylacidiphilales bacterium]|nr:aldolase/citrate lyase family protein [Candidatus Methylacidiphilales bacterium]
MSTAAFQRANLLSNLQALQHFPGAVIVRVPTHEPGLIGRVLDWGADGIMVPHVSSAHEAQKLVGAMRYPPHGSRGFSRTVRAYGYGLKPAGENEDAPLFFAQIECDEAVQNVSEIAEVSGVDVLFVGPADLQLSLSVSVRAGQPPSFEVALARVLGASRQHRKLAGILTRSPDHTSTLAAQGFTVIGVDSDLAILRKGFQAAAFLAPQD